MNGNEDKNHLLIILGITPVIALTDSVVNAAGFGILLIFTFIFSGIIYLPFRGRLKEPTDTFVLLILTATIASILNDFLACHFPQSASNLTLFLPLLAVNSFIVYTLKSYDPQEKKIKYILNHTKKFLICLLLLTITGALREIIGRGRLFEQALLISDPTTYLSLIVYSPPGAFLVMALVLFIYRVLRKK
ncbi:MAG: hypothetical protein N3A65_05940 [candidate division WOR-3 bacterium]|nr:hypothetical protein [candidate division WOR-3 bacterium]